MGDSAFEGAQFFGNELGGQILGLVGYGNVGSRVAKRALAFGMQVLVYDPYVAPTRVEGQGIKMTDLDNLLQGHRVVFDTGRKVIGSELGLPRLKDVPSTTAGIAEEHLLVDVDPGYPLKVGDRVEVISGYGPTTVNLHDVYYVVENDVVTDVWPIRARGAGLGPFC